MWARDGEWRPGCYAFTDDEVTPRAPWAKDRGRACMQAARTSASDPEWFAELLRAEPGCAGCRRAARARRLFNPPSAGDGYREQRQVGVGSPDESGANGHEH